MRQGNGTVMSTVETRGCKIIIRHGCWSIRRLNISSDEKMAIERGGLRE
jgi:hypothetical protein